MTLTDKLAALPPLISVDSWKEDGIGQLVVYAKDYNALLAHNALLCEALNDVLNYAVELAGEHVELELLIDTKAILAACEVKQP